LFALIAILSLLSLFILLRKTTKIQALWMVLFAGVFAFMSAALLFPALSAVSYPPPDIQTDYTHVCFDQQHSSFTISVKPSATMGKNQENYGTFFVWTQRVGCVPSVETTLQHAIAQGDIIVIINPKQPFTESDVQMITSFLENNGHILVLDSITNTDSTANELIGNFGIWITINTHDEALYEDGAGNHTNSSIGTITTPYLTLSGGKQILLTSQNETQACMAEVTNKTTGDIGKLVVVVDSYAFSDTVMGGTFTEPTEQQRRVYETEFFLFDTLLTP
jgi:hypothetical protein